MPEPTGRLDVSTQTRPDTGEMDEDAFAIHVLVAGLRCANGHVNRSKGVWVRVDSEVVTITCTRCDTAYVVAPVRSASSPGD